MREVYRLLMEAYLGRSPKGTLPLSAARALLGIPRVRKWLKVEKEGLDYFVCSASYDSSQAQTDLRGSGIQCPDFKDYVKAIVAYYRQHQNDPDKEIPIR